MRGNSEKLDSCFAFVFSSHWQNNGYRLSHPYVFMTKINSCASLTVPQLSFHTDLPELLSFENWELLEEKKKHFEAVSMMQKAGNLKVKMLSHEREHSDNFVIKEDAALNTSLKPPF